MRSPFQGMDPYVERYWRDFHITAVVRSANAIQRQLGEALVARIGQRTIRVWPGGRSICTVERFELATHSAGGEVHPVRLIERDEPITERFIQILDAAADDRLITVIEFVSPTNKLPGDGFDQYRQRQRDCYAAKVNLVEIDLTRGERTLLCHRWATARRYESTYQVSVWRAAAPSEVDLFPIGSHQRLPTVSIPLRVGEPEVTLDLQGILFECYADARYDRTIDYKRPPDPPLEGEDAYGRGS